MEHIGTNKVKLTCFVCVNVFSVVLTGSYLQQRASVAVG